MYYPWYRRYTWLDGIVIALALALLLPPLWYAVAVVGDAAALAEGNPTGVSLAPLTATVRGLAVGVLVGVEVLLPLSLYMDAKRLAEVDVDWRPKPETYALGGVLFPLSVFVGLYYLLRRTGAVAG